MTRKLNDIVSENYDIFTLVYDRFKNDNRFSDGSFHFEWPMKIAEMVQDTLISERINEARYGPQNETKTVGDKSSTGDNFVTVRLSDGKSKTIEHKDRLKSLGFYWNTPLGSKDWNKRMRMSEWIGLSTTDPFDKLTSKVIE